MPNSISETIINFQRSCGTFNWGNGRLRGNYV